MATLGKFEMRITVPTGGWAIRLTDADGTNVDLTIPAGAYYWNSVAPGGSVSFLAQLATTLTNGAGVTYTCSLDDGSDTSIGRIIITVSSGTFTITWTNLTVRDLLGFTGATTASSGTSALAPKQARYLWLPNTNREAETPDPIVGEASQGFGAPEADYRLALAPSGATARSVFSVRRAEKLMYEPLLGQKMWLSNEQTTNESFECFWLDYMAEGGAPFRLHEDRAVDGTYHTLVFDQDAQRLRPERKHPRWVGPKSHWRLEVGVRPYVTVNGV